MMKIPKIAKTLAEAALVVAVLANTACAAGAGKAEASSSAKSAAPMSEYTWYDGGQIRTVYLAPQLVADFAGGVKSAMPAARELEARGSVVIYEVTAGVNPVAVRAAVSATGSIAAVSPVFYDDGGGTGRRRALPGNVVVEFSPDRDAESVAGWADAEGLTLLRKLSFGNYYLVQSPAGMASLELANQLQQSGEVRSAQPNWWTEVVTR